MGLNFKIKKQVSLFLVFISLVISSKIVAQGNTPCTAVVITANATCVNTAGTTASLTYQSDAANGGTPSCASPGAADGWYAFTPTATATYTIDLTAGTITDSGMAIYTAASGCAAPFTEITCDDDGGTGTMSQIVTALTSGTTYYIRIWEYSSGTGTFSICITQGAPPPPAPANDAPCSATPVIVNTAPNTCTTQAGGTVVGATASGVALGACFGTADDDVWYSFVANNATQNISLNNLAGSTTDMYFSVYAGTCGALGAALLCSDPQSNTITGLTVGNTYYIRIYTYTGTTGQTSTFSVCINPPAPPPANDNPCSATPVPVNSAFTCTTQTGGTVAGATASGVALGACFGTADDDVWFTFVANNATQYISLNNLAGSTTDLYFSVYSGACGALSAALICSDPENNILTGLTVGTTYRIRVYSYTSTTGQTSTFSVCITPPPPVPANDNPCGATAAAVNSAPGTCTVQTAGTIGGATASGVALGACFGTADDDVWYSFVANATSMNININNITGSTTDLYHSVYSGACGALGAALICSDPNSSTITGLTIGNTYRIRIYSYTSTTGQTSSFSLCINPTPPPPVNVTCAQMQPICSGSPIVFQAQSGGGSAAPGPNYGCLSTTPNPTWFYLEILTSGTMAVDLTAGSDVDFALWGPYGSLATAQANCLTYPAPLDCSYSSSAIEQMNIPTAITGQVYAVLVTNYASIIQSITLNQAGGASATTNCAILLPVGLLYFNGTLNESNEVFLQWETETETNNDYFEIQTLIGDTWKTLAIKDGAGNSTSKTYYNYTDKKPIDGLSYYRLKQVNFDQTFNYSNAISIDLSKDREQITNIRPNPTNGLVYYDYISKSKADITIEVVSFTGESLFKETKNAETGFNSFNLSLQEFKNGVYLLKITNENSGKTFIQKVIKN